MEIKFLGHSCFQAKINGKHIVFDPFIRPNVLAAEAGIDIDDVQADYILVSHGHDDHTADLNYLAEKTGATIVSSWEICTWLNKQGITNTHPMNIGGKWKFDFGTVKITFAAHSSSLSDGTYAGIAAGFLIESNAKTLYYAGDTALNQEMKLIGEYYKIDWALLPIGDNFTMDHIDACRAAEYLGCKNIVAMHYDTFAYIKVDHEKAIKHFEEHGKILHMPAIGTTIQLH
jgi:L-ascorbate metabolism protein UlaG (beta-lactamase superfamily)